MHCDRWAEVTELVESTEDPNDRADQEMMRDVEFPESWISPVDDREDPDAWWRRLAAQIQLPDAAD
jgi:hypothetical protein